MGHRRPPRQDQPRAHGETREGGAALSAARRLTPPRADRVDPTRRPASLKIKGATIVTQDDERRILKDSDLYAEDGQIREIGRVKTEADIVIDGRHRVVIPGLVNAHTHLAMGLLRGYGDDMPLESWLRERIWPAEARLTEDSMRAGADLGLLELIASGTTSFLDMYFMEPILATATASAGLRGWMGWSMVDIETPEGETNPRLERLIPEFLTTWQGHPLVTPVVAPHGTYTCHAETLARCAELAAAHDTLLHIHCGETRAEIAEVESRYGRRPVAQLAAAGALTERTVLAHCGWTTKQEVQQIAQAGAKVAHCPVSNMKLATGGTAPVPEFLDAGVAVGLGTDGSASNNATSLFETMKLAAILHKQQRWDPTVIPAQTALDMATRHGAALLRQDGSGTLGIDTPCDITIIDFDRPHLVPMHDAVSNLVYAAQAGDVTHTIVAGRVLYADGEHTTMDREAVLERARSAAKQVTAA